MDDPQIINVAVSRAIQRFILVTNYDMLPTSRNIRDLVGYIRYHNPGEEVADSAVVSVFDLLYRAYSQRLQPLAARRARDALKNQILDAHQMPLLRLPTTGSREHQQIRQALDNAEAHWARLSTR